VSNFRQRLNERRAARRAERDERRKRSAADPRKTPKRALEDWADERPPVDPRGNSPS
jgi:hypothetical protein